MNKILILTTVHPINDPRIFYKELLSIKKVNKEVTFIVPNETKNEFIKEGTRIIPIPIITSRFKRVLKLQLQVMKIIKREGFDIIHFHDPELLVLCYLLKKIYSKIVIYDVHENVINSIEVREWIPSFLKKIMQVVFDVLENLLIKSFDYIIIAEKSYSKRYGNDALEILNYPKITTNYNSTKTSKDFEGIINFVYAGSITEIRGIWQMLKSFKRIRNDAPNSVLHLIGQFSTPELEDNVMKFIRDNRLENQVNLYGKLDLEKMYDVLSFCHVGYALIKPVLHHSEKLPGKIFDYMLFGIPVIATNFSIYNEYILDKNTGILVDYNNIEEITTKINHLLRDRNKLKVMSNNGLWYSKEWNWSTEEAKLHSLYRKLLG